MIAKIESASKRSDERKEEPAMDAEERFHQCGSGSLKYNKYQDIEEEIEAFKNFTRKNRRNDSEHSHCMDQTSQ